MRRGAKVSLADRNKVLELIEECRSSGASQSLAWVQLIASFSGLAEQFADYAVAVSRRLSGALDLLFRGSLRAEVGKKKRNKKGEKEAPRKGKTAPLPALSGS